MKKVLTIAGSDCCSGAGIQADIKTFAAHGVYGMSVVTSVVAENTMRVNDKEDVSPEILRKQIDIIFEDMGIDAVKIGMLPNAASMKVTAECLQKYNPPNIVVDPVMIASTGGILMKEDAISTFINEIIPTADLLTPNIPEAEMIAQMTVKSPDEMEIAAEKIRKAGAKAVLIKGGHAFGEAVDILSCSDGVWRFTSPRINIHNVHGTGCTLSSAIAANLAHGCSLTESIRLAKDYITDAIRYSFSGGKGDNLIDHFHKFYKNSNVKGVLKK